MGPIYGTMVETAQLCADGYLENGAYCPGWAEDGGIERRCMWKGHLTRSVRAADAIADAGVTARQFDAWAGWGYLRTQASPGSGHYRKLSDHEVAVVRLMGRLVRAGVLPSTATRLAHDLWDGKIGELADGMVLGVRRAEDYAVELGRLSVEAMAGREETG